MKIPNKSLKFILLILSLCAAMHGMAQSPLITKIEQSLEDQSYKRALTLCEEAMEDPELRKSAVPFLLAAETLYYISRDEYLSGKNPDAIKMAMKYISKAADKVDGSREMKIRSVMVDSVVKANNREAEKLYQVNSYFKAFREFQNGYLINNDTAAYLWMGKTALQMLDTATGMLIYDSLIQRYNLSFEKFGKTPAMAEEPFVFFADYYWNRQKYDSAAYYLILGKNIFDKQPRINYYLTQIYKDQISTMVPSNFMKERLAQALRHYPQDTFFIRKDNAVHLYLYRKYLEQGNTGQAELLVNEFAEEKVRRYNDPKRSFYEKNDGFVSEKTADVFWKMAKYYYQFNHFPASRSLVQTYILRTAEGSDEAAVVKRWIVITDFAFNNESLGFSAQILKAGTDLYPQNKDLAQYRKSLALKGASKELDLNESMALRDILIDEIGISADPAIVESLKKISTQVIPVLMKKGDYQQAASIAKAEWNRTTDTKMKAYWEGQRKLVAQEDFYYNYYETRIMIDSSLGEAIPEFEWNGDPSTCFEGDVRQLIQNKVETRINYFRRNAGVTEILLTPELNDRCQKAALMMESNKKLDHNPQKNWKCYSAEGAEAAKFGLLTVGATTTKAVTSFFADNQNKALGNRRWLLYPNAREFGHGSTSNYSCIWALDDSGRADSALYRKQFIAWPNEGYLPAMMVFDHWSFSMYRDLKGATVTMKRDGVPVKLVQQPLTAGYGMPTLVWTPEIDAKKIDKETKIDVSIRFSDGSTVNYQVVAFPFNAAAY